jgi:perosamine synthetase
VSDSYARIRLASPDLGEEELDAVRRVLASGVLTNGPENEAFGQEFAERHKTAFGVTFCTGTAALAAMLLAEGIGPGDEVVVPSPPRPQSATSVPPRSSQTSTRAPSIWTPRRSRSGSLRAPGPC